MKLQPLFSIAAVSALFLFVACGNDNSASSNAGDNATTAGDTPGAEYRVTPFEPSHDYPDAQIANMQYSNKQFRFDVKGESYRLGDQTPDAPQKMCANSAQGQHLHLIVDDNPYVAQYTAEFEHEIADGEHYLLAFLSRSYHESLKHSGASISRKVTVKDNSIAKVDPITQPMIFYSRPKGKYVGKAETDKVMLDFYLVNAGLSASGNKVRAKINDQQEVVLDSWQPFYIEGLPMGDNKIELTLLDENGNPVPSPLNPVTRVFTLVPDPAEAVEK